MARVPDLLFWLQWGPNKQLPNVLLEGASTYSTRLFFSFSTALNSSVHAFALRRNVRLR